MTRCDEIHPTSIDGGEEHGFDLHEKWPGGVEELSNDGVDNCPVCNRRGNAHANHGHVPTRWIRTPVGHGPARDGRAQPGGRAWYHCDVCGHDWMCSWALRAQLREEP